MPEGGPMEEEEEEATIFERKVHLQLDQRVQGLPTDVVPGRTRNSVDVGIAASKDVRGKAALNMLLTG